MTPQQLFLATCALLPSLCSARAPAAFFNRPPIVRMPPPPSPAPKPEPVPKEEPQGPRRAQFAQATPGQAVQLKQVEGSNDGGGTTTPELNMASWYSDPFYDLPTSPSWMNGDYPDQPTTSEPIDKPAEAAGPAQARPYNNGGGGGGMPGIGSRNAKKENEENEARALHQALVKTGRDKEIAAGTTPSNTVHSDEEHEVATQKLLKRKSIFTRARVSHHDSE